MVDPKIQSWGILPPHYIDSKNWVWGQCKKQLKGLKAYEQLSQSQQHLTNVGKGSGLPLN